MTSRLGVTRPRLVLLDLDGTLSDSADGIVASMRHAFVEHGIEPPPEATLRTFVGPPFASALAGLGYDEQFVDALVQSYRADYSAGRLFDNEVYPGIEDALGVLTAAGIRLAVATSKPQETARRIVAHFGLQRYLAHGLDSVHGANPCVQGETKADVIARALDAENVSAGPAVVMVGDRMHDVHGAAAHGLACVGVTWGYAAAGELEEAGAAAVVETPQDLVKLLMHP